MKNQIEILSSGKLVPIQTGYDGGGGYVYLNGTKKEPATVIWSFGKGWDHVSVSYRRRTPTWEEMSKIKDIFFNEEETVVQFHPKKSEYKNLCETCLHLWRKQGEEYELPPRAFV